MQLKTTTLITLALLLNGSAARSEKLPEDLQNWRIGVTYSYYNPIFLYKSYGINFRNNWTIHAGFPPIFLSDGEIYEDYSITTKDEKLFTPLSEDQEDGFSLYRILNKKMHFMYQLDFDPRTKILPDEFFIYWKTIAERKQYGLRYPISDQTHQMMLTPRQDSKGKTCYQNFLTFGLLPEGEAQIFLMGDDCGEATPLGRVFAQKMKTFEGYNIARTNFKKNRENAVTPASAKDHAQLYPVPFWHFDPAYNQEQAKADVTKAELKNVLPKLKEEKKEIKIPSCWPDKPDSPANFVASDTVKKLMASLAKDKNQTNWLGLIYSDEIQYIKKFGIDNPEFIVNYAWQEAKKLNLSEEDIPFWIFARMELSNYFESPYRYNNESSIKRKKEHKEDIASIHDNQKYFKENNIGDERSKQNFQYELHFAYFNDKVYKFEKQICGNIAEAEITVPDDFPGWRIGTTSPYYYPVKVLGSNGSYNETRSIVRYGPVKATLQQYNKTSPYRLRFDPALAGEEEGLALVVDNKTIDRVSYFAERRYLPDDTSVYWLSLAEDKYYELKYPITDRVKQAMLKARKRANGSTCYASDMVFGLLPAGDVKVYLDGCDAPILFDHVGATASSTMDGLNGKPFRDKAYNQSVKDTLARAEKDNVRLFPAPLWRYDENFNKQQAVAALIKQFKLKLNREAVLNSSAQSLPPLDRTTFEYRLLDFLWLHSPDLLFAFEKLSGFDPTNSMRLAWQEAKQYQLSDSRSVFWVMARLTASTGYPVDELYLKLNFLKQELEQIKAFAKIMITPKAIEQAVQQAQQHGRVPFPPPTAL